MGAPNGQKPAVREDRWIPSACTICYGGCSILAHRVDGTVVKIEGNPASPVGNGHICAKGLAGIMILYDPNRLNVPLRRTNPVKGLGVDPGWKPISWEEALEEITVRMEKIRAEDPRQLMIQATTTLAPSSLLFFTFGWAFGTPNMWVAGGGVHCGNGAHAVGGIMHASWSLVPDFKHCNYALYFGASKGHGAGHASTPNMELAADARARGMRMVVVDPLCNFAAAKANEWVPVRVGTDAALALAMANCLVNELGIWDAEYLTAKTNGPYLVRPDGTHARDAATGKPLVWVPAVGAPRPHDDPAAAGAALEGTYDVAGERCRTAFDLLREHLKSYPAERAERISGVPAATVRRLAQEFGAAARVGSTIVLDGVRLPYRPAAAIYFRGAQGHKNSSHNCFAIDLLNQL
ncbi:MAG: molybdopterin-dependent oxidoreductase, partial [Candidatus Rokubacteria bacterium]|nr:molybdopterin-dependent oxidoreductase [Candidatus Rokubacteria bacterium]